jgi:hypothetical protein
VPLPYGTGRDLFDHAALRYASEEQFVEAVVPLIEQAITRRDPGSR